VINPELNNALQELQHEIDNNPNMDEAIREKMVGLKPDIQRALVDPDHHPTLRERMTETAAHLEADHPTLAAAIESVVNILNNLGV
jgi:hypothetical protein